jgi:hypothetical protein
MGWRAFTVTAVEPNTQPNATAASALPSCSPYPAHHSLSSDMTTTVAAAPPVLPAAIQLQQVNTCAL